MSTTAGSAARGAGLTPGRWPGVTGRPVSADGPFRSASRDAVPNPAAAMRWYVAHDPTRSADSGTVSSADGAGTGAETRGAETLAAGLGASDSIGTTGTTGTTGAGAAAGAPPNARTAAVTAASSIARAASSPEPERDR